MEVIGAGLPRTATLSQKVALEMLGLGPCYHMVNVLGDLDLVPQWRRALEGDADWDEIFGDCNATVDWPGSFFYRELMEAYPDAKVLLSVRDGDAWARSMRQTIWGTLLVWEAADGWEPLCAFLGLPPETPFPRLNDSAQFVDRIIDGSLLAIQRWRNQEEHEAGATRSGAADG